MKKILSLVLLSAFVIACNNSNKTMHLSGTVKGLKKGTLFLQKTIDSTLVTIDSIQIKGNGDFSFSTEIESPEIFYLYLTKEDQNTYNDRITFFGEPGTITISTSWNSFDTNAVIKGSKNTEKLNEYKDIMSQFNKKSLLYATALNNYKTTNNIDAIDSVQKLYNKNIIASYRYIINFSLNNKDAYVTPYIALTEAPDANVLYLDSIYKSLLPSIANSKYGKKLKAHITTIQSK